MGSKGTGRLTDYPGGRGGGAGSGGSGSGSEQKVNQCEQLIEGVALEEVERCDYYQAHSDVPPPGTAAVVRSSLLKGRVAVETDDGESIGVLPTKFNYLVGCMKRGYVYSGEVVASQPTPVPSVTVNLGFSK